MSSERAVHRENPASLADLCSVLRSGNVLVLGVGSPLRGDDSAGLVLCDLLVERGVSCERCEYGVENCLDVIAERKPNILVLLDALVLEGGKPGDVVASDLADLVDTARLVVTHGMPLRLVLEILRGIDDTIKVYLIGVHPRSLEVGSAMSREVYSALVRLADDLAKCLRSS